MSAVGRKVLGETPGRRVKVQDQSDRSKYICEDGSRMRDPGMRDSECAIQGMRDPERPVQNVSKGGEPRHAPGV